MTKQRDVILTELRKLETHPTADELYPIVRKIIPNISLGTVYRNLNLLADQGIIIQIEHGGTQKRFDGKAHRHYHFRCQQCRKLYDLELQDFVVLEQSMKSLKQHQVNGYQLEFYGVCQDCLKKETMLDK